MRRNGARQYSRQRAFMKLSLKKEGVSNRLRTLQKDRRVILNGLSIQIQYPITPSQDIYESVPLKEINESEQHSIMDQALKAQPQRLVSGEEKRREKPST